MTLWIILTLMAAIAAAVLTIPLVRRQEARSDARAATLAVLKDQLVDVDVQLAAGTIPPADAEGLRVEIKRRMLAAGHIPADLDRPIGARALGGLAIGLVALVTFAATAMYASMGKPEIENGAPAVASGATATTNAPAETQAAPEIAQLVTGLERKLAANPQDAEGWRMLGWSYFQTQRFADAAKAYAKAVALKPDGEGLQSAYGEALVQAGQGEVTPAAVAAFTAARAKDGADARARYFLALARQQRGDGKGAIDDWLALLSVSPGDAPWVPQLRQVIQQTADAAKIDVTARLAAIRPPTSGGATVPSSLPPGMAAANAASGAGRMPGPDAAQVAGAAAMTPADRQAMIRGMVDGLATKLKANPRDEAGWLRLMRARSVLGDAAAATAARDEAIAAFGDDKAAQDRIRAAATEIGIAG